MSAVTVRLQWALGQLQWATNNLGLALQAAKEQGYDHNWLDAIEKARARNEETHRQVANIRTNIYPPQ